MYIQMMTIASDHQLWCQKKLPTGMIKVFTLRKEKVTIQESYKNRTEFFISNTTFKLMDLERNDTGLYSVEVYDHNGILVENMELMLDIQGKCLKCTVMIQLISALYWVANQCIILSNIRKITTVKNKISYATTVS